MWAVLDHEGSAVRAGVPRILGGWCKLSSLGAEAARVPEQKLGPVH